MHSKNNSQRDTVYAKVQELTAFVFDEAVTQVFPNMIRRSAPGYETSQDLIEAVAAHYVQPRDVVYDLGCSVGESTFRLARSKYIPQCEIFGIDSSHPMIEACKNILQTGLENNSFNSTLYFLEQKAEDVQFKPCRLVLLNYVLQFISLKSRLQLLQRIYDALLPNSILLLSEKIILPAFENDLAEKIHTQFKKCQGYSELEIAQKRNALQGVLISESLTTHVDRLKSVGFNQVQVLAQGLQFITLIACK
ncbi:MAG: carboxy-S-adenosyl-L-methionine synthase CmoA [Pseudomonadota bacterium]